MLRIISLILIIIICSKCKSSYIPYSIEPGEFSFYYSSKETDREHLILKHDSTFKLTLYGGPYCPSCDGKWKFIDKNTIRIECFPDKNPLAPISSGYMSLRVREIKVINNIKLKMPIENNVKRKYVILERVEAK